MECVYLLRERALEGPYGLDRAEALLAADAVADDTPAWMPGHRLWQPCAELLRERREQPLISFAGPESEKNTRAIVAPVLRVDLPAPRNLYALRLAREQELLTVDQIRRCEAELWERPDPAHDLVESLAGRGWITRGQQSLLQAALQRDSELKLLGGYEILAELGRGGMGVTYRARQLSMDRIVALKVLLPRFSADAEYVHRFEREAKMAARLNHENIATAYEVGSVAGQHFFSMEFVEGKTLASLIAERGRLAEAEAVRIVIQVLRALQEALACNLMHRDVSPKNIILKSTGQVKLIDMGLAKSLSPESSGLTTIGMTVGTPAYMAPEQAMGRPDLDIRADLYSVGCILYEALTGEPPLQGTSVVETLARHIQETVPPVKAKRADASSVVCHVVQRLTAMRPEDRYTTPAEAIEGFEVDAETARLALPARAPLPPVREQLALWKGGESASIRLQVGQREYVHLIARKLDERLQESRTDPETQGYIQTVFAELVANAFDHGARGLAEGVIAIRLELNEAFFRLDVEDPGSGFAAQEMLERIRSEPVDRERRRGIMQILGIADILQYSPKGNHVKAVLYCKSSGSGIHSHVSGDLTYVEIRGKGDLALAEEFRRFVEAYPVERPERLCLLIRTEWISSMFVGAIGKLQARLEEAGSALSVWPEHRSCFKILQQLGVTSFVRVYDSLEMAEMSLRFTTLRQDEGAPKPAPAAPVAPAPVPGRGPSTRAAAEPRSESARAVRPSRRESVETASRRDREPPPGLLGQIRRKLGL